MAVHAQDVQSEGGGAYLPIADYAVIGNLRTIALVGRNGSIDWCCLPELSRPSVFAALLDQRRGGHFKVAVAGLTHTEQRYLGDSCVLETRHAGEGGRLSLLDFMPLAGTIIGARDPRTEPAIHRVLHVAEGEAEVVVEWAPRFDYARSRTRMERRDDLFLASAGDECLVLSGLPPAAARILETEHGPTLYARFRMQAGESRALVTGYVAPHVRHAAKDVDTFRADLDTSIEKMRGTREVWVRWAHDNEEMATEEWAGEWASLVTRSELTLKMLTHPDTGAIAAAATTSLPEDIGGVRNWDYRYCWVRDSTFTVESLYALGHSAEADDFLEFLQRSVQDTAGWDGDLQIMYGLHGEKELDEAILDHLEGYRGSAPVRIGNGAAAQNQHDTLGELIDSAHELARRGVALSADLKSLLSKVATQACRVWNQPDQGIWEMRGPPHHHVYSKVMVWVALDRAVDLAKHAGLEGDVDGWRRTRDMLRDLVLRRGYDPELGSFTMSFGSKHLDAANLLLPVRRFLPAGDPRVQGTIARTMEHLVEDGLVYRYRMDDGLPGDEGAFGLCTFWLVDALALSGRVEEAREIFRGMAGRANHVGLLSEQVDPASGAFLGNFPQAFTHLGLITSLLYLRQAEGRRAPYTPIRRDPTWAMDGEGVVG